MKSIALVIICLFVSIAHALPQQKATGQFMVKGTVTAFKHLGINNVQVAVRKSKMNTVTDANGYFEIMASEGDLLTFKASGFVTNSRKVENGQDSLFVNMVFIPGDKNTKVAVGYGHLSEHELTHAMVNYQNENNDYWKYNSLAALFQAVIPGATVRDDGGLKVYFRGSENVINSQFSSNTGVALYVVDGMISETIDFLSVKDIRFISVLKGPEAAMYGTQGANGVILITTKTQIN